MKYIREASWDFYYAVFTLCFRSYALCLGPHIPSRSIARIGLHVVNNAQQFASITRWDCRGDPAQAGETTPENVCRSSARGPTNLGVSPVRNDR